jgi:dihydropteroate synthase
LDIPLSVDTTKASVAEAALKAGASIIKRHHRAAGGSRHDGLARDSGCAVVLMHMRGTPGTCNADRIPGHVSEIYTFLDEGSSRAWMGASLRNPSSRNPGIASERTSREPLSACHISEFQSLHVPVMVGHSRKSFLGGVLGTDVDRREEGTDAVTAWCAMHGVDLVRVHDCTHAQRIRSVMRAVMEAP